MNDAKKTKLEIEQEKARVKARLKEKITLLFLRHLQNGGTEEDLRWAVRLLKAKLADDERREREWEHRSRLKGDA